MQEPVLDLERNCRVAYCGFDGNWRFVDLQSIEDACIEALRLRHFYDGVDIVDAKTGNPVEF